MVGLMGVAEVMVEVMVEVVMMVVISYYVARVLERCGGDGDGGDGGGINVVVKRVIS